MAYRAQVNSQLVRSSSLQPAFEQRGISENIQTLPVSHGPFAAASVNYRDLLAVCRRPRERGVDRSSAVFRITRYDGEVTPIDRVRGELLGQAFVRNVGFGDDQQPRCVLVDPMHNTRPSNAADPG